MALDGQSAERRESVQKHAQIALGKTCPGITDMLPYLLLPIATSSTVIFDRGGTLT